MLFKKRFTAGTPHKNTNTLNNIQGSHACRIRCAEAGGAAPQLMGTLAARSGEFSVTVSSNFGGLLAAGRQNWSKTNNPAIEQSEARMSTSHGPWKLEMINCGIAKQAPAVSAAGHTSSIPRKPAI